MHHFLSCDWGTTSFRLRFVNTGGSLFTIENKTRGIGSTFQSWKETGAPEVGRFAFFRNVMADAIHNVGHELNADMTGIPIVVSGMASSSIGMVPLDYKEAPFNADGSDLSVHRFEASAEFPHVMFVISGARNHNDVMRGEETQLAGCYKPGFGDSIWLFPGTHSKHVFVSGNRVIDFNTYMTGELFELLARKSVLSTSVEEGSGIGDKKNADSFEAGVLNAAKANILHSLFSVRTNRLFEKLTPVENYYYLSGLLIGTELTAVARYTGRKIILVAGQGLQPFYVAAMQLLDLYSGHLVIADADDALVKGQQAIAGRYLV